MRSVFAKNRVPCFSPYFLKVAALVSHGSGKRPKIDLKNMTFWAKMPHKSNPQRPKKYLKNLFSMSFRPIL
jgi:hypothetical protein